MQPEQELSDIVLDKMYNEVAVFYPQPRQIFDELIFYRWIEHNRKKKESIRSNADVIDHENYLIALDDSKYFNKIQKELANQDKKMNHWIEILLIVAILLIKFELI